jgi:GNAT superfamily N-acetyltransferase
METIRVRIRRAHAGDAAVLTAFATRTFEEAFSHMNEPAHMAAYLEQAYGLAQQTAELSNPDVITLLAYVEDRLAAFTQLRRRPPPACVTGAQPIELWRFYVDRPWQGRGVAQRLMTAVFAAARDMAGRTLWLGAWERNPRALTFYARCGFRDVGTDDFWLGSDRQTDRVLEADLSTAG